MRFECLSHERMRERALEITDRPADETAPEGAQLVVAVVDYEMTQEAVDCLVVPDATALLAKHGELMLLRFDDVEDEPFPEGVPLFDEDAEAVVRAVDRAMVRRPYGDAEVVFSCPGGVGRSAAMALFFRLLENSDVRGFFDGSLSPNATVMRRLNAAARKIHGQQGGVDPTSLELLLAQQLQCWTAAHADELR